MGWHGRISERVRRREQASFECAEDETVLSREREIEGVAIVKFRMKNRRGHYAGSFEI